MKTSAVSKSDTRESLMYLYYGVHQVLQTDAQVKVKDWKQQLKKLINNIKTKYQNSANKEEIRKALKEETAKLVAAADDLVVDKKFKTSQLLYDIFDGIPISKEIPHHRAYDVVVKQDESRTIAWVFCADGSHDPIMAQVEAEQDYGIPCIDVKLLRQTAPKVITKSALIKKLKPTEQEPATEKTESETLGKVLFSKKEQYVLRVRTDKDEVNGFIYEQYASTVHPGDILVLESQDLTKKIYAQVLQINVNPLSGGGYVHQFSEVVTHIKFRPLMEVAADWKGRPRASDLSGFTIRRTTKSELTEVLNIPQEGLPIGKLDYIGTHEVFKYPLKPEDTIFQSSLIAGVQGKGKSNFLKLLVRALATCSTIEPHKRPAIVILDGEGEYKEFTKKSEMLESTKQFLDKCGIGDILPKIYTIGEDAAKTNATLSLRGIDKQDVVYLLPELESKTENILRVLMNHVIRQIEYEKAPQDIETLRNRLLAENNNSQLIHMQQRPAIARAILSPSLNLLDQKDKIPLTPSLLFKPGTVSVIDYQGLDQNKKRVVALYLLQMLDKYKMNQPNLEPGVLLVIDEAEVLFPENPSKGDKDYVLRIASRMEDITNRGRKRKYGVTLVTHLPTEVSRKVGDLANTKIAFGCSGAERWSRAYFGRDYVDEISNMPTGKCRITIKINTNDQGPINARLHIPYVGDKRAISDKEAIES